MLPQHIFTPEVEQMLIAWSKTGDALAKQCFHDHLLDQNVGDMEEKPSLFYSLLSLFASKEKDIEYCVTTQYKNNNRVGGLRYLNVSQVVKFIKQLREAHTLHLRWDGFRLTVNTKTDYWIFDCCFIQKENVWSGHVIVDKKIAHNVVDLGAKENNQA